MTEGTSEDGYRAAVERAVKAKRWMDSVQAELDQAEDEYHQACRALDDLENLPNGESKPATT